MLTLILAVIGGFVATTILVMLTMAISAKMMLGSATELGAPPTSFSVVSLVLGVFSAFGGGWVAVRIASGDTMAPMILAGTIGVLGLVSAIRTPVDKRNGQPGWYLYLLPITGAIGALLGGGVLP